MEPHQGRRRWTLETARAVFSDVRARTEGAVDEVDALEVQREQAQGAERKAIEQRLQRVLARWVREMEALGVEVKGAWLVDFDCGHGFYCWRWPEPALAHFHGYEEGFEDRVRIQ